MYLHFSLSLSPSAYFLAYRLIVISFLIFLCFFIILAIFCSLACFFRPQSLSFPSPSPLSINLSGTCGHRSPFTLFSIIATPHLAWMFCFCVYRMYLLNNKILFLFSSLALRFALFALFFVFAVAVLCSFFLSHIIELNWLGSFARGFTRFSPSLSLRVSVSCFSRCIFVHNQPIRTKIICVCMRIPSGKRTYGLHNNSVQAPL